MRDITIEDIVEVIHAARTDPNSQTVVALRLALEEIDRQAQQRRDHIEVQQDLAGATDWRDVANNQLPHDELERRRAVPVPPPRQPEPDPELVEAFHRAEETTAMSTYWTCPDPECRAEVPEEEPECLACLSTTCPTCFDDRGAHPDGEFCSSTSADHDGVEQESRNEAWRRDDEAQADSGQAVAR